MRQHPRLQNGAATIGERIKAFIHMRMQLVGGLDMQVGEWFTRNKFHAEDFSDIERLAQIKEKLYSGG